MISVHQIYFNKKSEYLLDNSFKPYLNEKKDGYFENSVIADIYKQINCTSNAFLEADKYIGVTSWKQQSKTNLTGVEIISHIKKDIESGIEKDVYIYPPTSKILDSYENVPEGYDCNGTIKAPDLWTQHKGWGKKVHPINVLLNNAKILPYNIFDEKWAFCHCNYWIAKKEIYKEYCEQILLPVIDFFEREDIKKTKPCVVCTCWRWEKVQLVFIYHGSIIWFVLGSSKLFIFIYCKKEDK